ncbi:MAG: pitrilysin family protein [Acidobacteriota bacterium]|nr:pitrilysin family protein [Acidobacteriota bacterium]
MTSKRRYRFLAIAVLMLLPALSFAQTRRTPQRPAPERLRPAFLKQARSLETTPYVTRLVLRNGLTILAEEIRTQSVVSVQVHIQAGSLHEPPGSIGVSRLLASLIERGPADSMLGGLRRDVHALGGKLSHSVDYLHTQFEIVAPSSRWKQALGLLINAVQKADLNSDSLSVETRRVLNEVRLALADPEIFGEESLLALAFGQPRMARFGEIAAGGLKDLKLQNLTDFYRSMYTPQKTTLVLSGDISANEVFDEIVRLYAKPQAASAKVFDAAVRETQNGFRYRQIRGNVALPRILYGFHAAPESAEDFRALEVLNAILGTGEGAVLNSRLKNQMKLIYRAQTNLRAQRDSGCLVLQMDVDPENIDRSEIAALTEIELLKRKGPDEAEMVRAKAQLERNYWKRRETVSERAGLLAYYDAQGNWKRPANYLSEIRNVEPADIRRVANKYLHLNRCALLELLPEAGPPRDTTVEGMRQTLEGLLEASADQEWAKREKEVAPFFKIPESKDTFRFSEVEYPFQVASILRGPDMYVREDHTSALIEMGFFFRGGKLMEKKENAGITCLLTHLMLLGTKEIPAPQFHRQLELYGARVEPVIADDYFGFMFSVLSENFSAAFDLFQQAVKAPVFEKDTVERLKDIQKKEILERKTSGAFAHDLLNEALFRDFAYSWHSLGTEASLDSISEDSLLKWHGEYVRNRKPYIVIIGDTKGTSLATHFVKHFSGSRIQQSKLTEEWAKPLEKQAIVEQSWKRDESLILIGFQAASMDDEDGVVMRVLEKLIGNQDPPSVADRKSERPEGRISAMYCPRLRGGSFIVGLSGSPESEAAMLDALKGEIEQVVSGPNTYREVRSAAAAAAGAFQIKRQTRSEQIRQVMTLLLTGRGMDTLLSLPAELQMIAAEDLAEIAPKVLDMNKAVIVRLHGTSD